MPASVVQVGTAVGFNNTSTAAVSLTGVTAGNSILIYCPLYSDATPAEPSATSYTLARRGSITNGSSSRSASFLYRHNVSAGTHNITVNTSAASGFQFGYAIPFEVSGLANAAPNVTMPAANGANGQNDASPTTGTSGGTTVATCFIVAGMCLAAGTADAGIDTPATTGYTNHGVRQISTSEVAYSFDSKSVSSTGTQSAAWGTLSASAEWGAVLVAFEESAATAVPRLMLLGVG